MVLLRPASVTHSVSFDQRLVELDIASFNGTTLMVRPPTNANVAPPGFYLLFVVQDSATAPLPSMLGEFVKVKF